MYTYFTRLDHVSFLFTYLYLLSSEPNWPASVSCFIRVSYTVYDTKYENEI